LHSGHWVLSIENEIRVMPVKIAFKASIAFLAAAFGISAGAAQVTVEPYTQVESKALAAEPTKAQRAKATRVTQFALGSLTLPKAAPASSKMGVPLQIGFGRPVPGLERDAAASLDWEDTPQGTKVTALSITSASAAALRAGLLVESLPAGAMLRFYTPYGDAIQEVSGREVLDTIARNVAADGESADARTFWSPPLDGATTVIEIELPANARVSDVRVSVPNVTHLVTSAKQGFAMPKEMVVESLACENAAICSIGTWGAQMNSVARMTFQVGASGFLCTGTLIANSNNDSTPYFLTANHCFSNQTSASTLTTWWFYRDTGCVTGTLNPGMVQLNGGATFLYGSNTTDTTFVRLSNAPPVGAVFAGFQVGTPSALNGAITGIHHPGGDLQKITFGNLTAYGVCTPPTGGSFTCNSINTNPTGKTFYLATWTSGLTEPGSSGSPIFDAGKFVVGQLYGGSSTCANIASGEFYGRLDVAYNAGVNQFLSPPLPTFALSVSKNGTGLGTLTTTPAGINCGATCTGNFVEDSDVTVTATATPGSLFAGWGGACSGTGACVVTMSAAQSVSATFNLAPPVTLTVVKAGTGTGTVTSAPAGINCGLTCSALFAASSTVTLSAAPSGGGVFTGWSGGGCSGSGACTVTMNGAQSVTAIFAPPPQMSVTKLGTGTGTVTSTPAGIACGATCGAAFNANNNVTFTAVADPGSVFAGWGTSCTGTRGCTVTMTGDKALTATFNLSGPPRVNQYMLNVSLAGTGSGTVTSAPAGINCGATCGANFDQATVVSLTPTAASGSTFAGWAGACSGTGACAVTMNAAASVTATFNASGPPPPGNQTLTIVKAGTGSGSVTSSPAGINCGATCSAGFATGTMVHLTAMPDSGSTFAGFTGACVNTRTTCTVTMSAAASVTVTFNGTGTPPPTQQALSVTLAGTGTGSVTSSPAGINCGATCGASFNTGTPVTLTATAGVGSTFTGWSGACSGTGACVVTMNAAASVTATFDTTGGGGGGSPTLTIVKAGAGAGLGGVTSSPAGINCGATCSAQFTSGARITLTANVPAGHSFGGWSGACVGTRTTCTISALSADGTVTATFN
jgi:List-Bact-rpt repeat protein